MRALLKQTKLVFRLASHFREKKSHEIQALAFSNRASAYDKKASMTAPLPTMSAPSNLIRVMLLFSTVGG
jgi:hypothetical protein